MQKRLLGQSDIAISPLVLGGNVFGWTVDEKQSFALLDRFIDAGFNTIDTADAYMSMIPGNSGGESETVLGHWLSRRGRRDDVILMTKVGIWEKYKGLRAATIQAAVEESLQRLQTDYIDVYFAHRDDQQTPQEETLEAFSRLVDAGKVRITGASNYSVERLESALACSKDRNLTRFDVLQPQYNLVEREHFEQDLLRTATEHNLGVVCYFGLASGFLTGKYRKNEDFAASPRGDFAKQYGNDRGWRVLAAMDAIAQETGGSLSQIALAWLMARPGISAPIASATSTGQLDDILGAARLSLSPQMMAALDAASG